MNPTAMSSLLILFTISCFTLSYCTSTRNINGGNININRVCPEIEREALLSFKESLEDPSDILSTWNISADVNCCNWKGVVCNNITGGDGHVHELRLQSYDQFGGLRGKIDPSLLNLKHLRYLDLSHNSFEETIPSFIGSLTSLEYLNLSRAGFYGNIPRSIGNLSNLHTLSLECDDYGRCQLDVDSIEWLSGLSQLAHLNMNYVNLSRAAGWLQVIDTLPSLAELRCSYCSLHFAINPLFHNVTTSSLAILDLSGNNFQPNLATPRWIFQLSNLIYLDLSFNSFQGPIPTISNTTKLQHIDLSINRFNSTVPDWLYSLKDLEFLDLSKNYLQGPLSNDIANLASLNTLDLSLNQLSGKIPRGIVHLCKIQTLCLSDNKLQGEISDSFGNNTSDCFIGALKHLDLSDNQLFGNLTPQFGEFKSLKSIDLGFNNLSGAIPINIGKLSSLETLNLAGNKLTGNLPESVGQLFNLKFLHIEDDKLEGFVSEIHFVNLTKLKHLSASASHLTLKVRPNWIPPFKLELLELRSWNLGEGAQILTWLETQKNTIQGLDLSGTGISGNLPDWIWKLQFLNLSRNQLNGSIHFVSSDSGSAQSVDLSSNQFSGSLPQVPANMLHLDFSNNSFSRGLSHFLCDVNETYTMFFLHLGGNQLSGEIPNCWMKWPSLIYLNLGNNILSGSIPNSIRFLEELRSLNLYNNRISGQIPFSMLDCTRLVKIDLADNGLDGSVPTWMGTSLTNLRILILRSNNLSGEISSNICHLNFLQILDLSDNNIFGTIPKCFNNFTAMTAERFLVEYDNEQELTEVPNFVESASIATKGTELQYNTILGLVTNIDLSKNNLSGDIPRELTSLVELRSLNLSGNHFTGLIPASIGDMKQLESLDLSRNYLFGEMPNSFRVMSTLNYLNVSYNQLTGKIPESTQIRGFNASSFIGNDDLCGPPLTSSCSTSAGPNMNREDNNHQSDDEQYKIEWFYVFVSLGYAVGLFVFCTTLVVNKSWREAYCEFMEEMWNRVYVYFYIKWRKLTKPSD